MYSKNGLGCGHSLSRLEERGIAIQWKRLGLTNDGILAPDSIPTKVMDWTNLDKSSALRQNKARRRTIALDAVPVHSIAPL